MSHSVSKCKVLILTVLISLAACNKPVEISKPSAEKTVTGPKTFATPSEAGDALLAASQSGDRAALLAIFGPEGEEVLFTGDAARDKAALGDFVTAYTRMNRWGNIKAGGQILYIGEDNYAFPVPLGQDSSGRWYFDTAAGKDEILARRIGRAELTAMAALEALADAQREYLIQTKGAGKVKQYAAKFVSDPGTRNGLYWAVTEGQTASPLDQLGDFVKAVSTAGDQSPRFNGYSYRILTKPGGFAILAYPSEYRQSGIMSFLVGKDGAIYEKDLGENTRELALGMSEFDTANGWSLAMPPKSFERRVVSKPATRGASVATKAR